MILLVPIIAMQFTDQVKWGIVDFVIAGFMLSIIGCCIDALYSWDNRLKVIFSLLIIVAMVLLWIELAVGIFGALIAGN